MQKILFNNKYLYLLVAAIVLCLTGCHDAGGVLDPKGVITFEERQLMFDSLALMLIVVFPVIIMSFGFVYRYHESQDTSEYRPEWCHSVTLETIWWGVPMAIIMVLAIMTYTTTHKLDPYNRIHMIGKPLEVKVVALPWKWLFIYPEQNIATVNSLALPVDRQVHFRLTTDNVPMSAFFIPQLGSQIYTMAGMQTQLHLVPTVRGTFVGLNSQYNGEGFSDMNFKVHVVDDKGLQAWFDKAKSSTETLSAESYRKLRQASKAHPNQSFSGIAPDLFKTIIESYKAAEHPA